MPGIPRIEALLKVRGYTLAEFQQRDYILAMREIGYATDAHILAIGDGVTGWNTLDTKWDMDVIAGSDPTTIINDAGVSLQEVWSSTKVGEMFGDLYDVFLSLAPQSLTSGQKKQVRTNIGAAGFGRTYALLGVSSYTAVHDISYPPDVRVLNDLNQEVETDVQHVSATEVYVQFAQPFTGTLILQ